MHPLGSILPISPSSPSVLVQGLTNNVGPNLFSPIGNPLDNDHNVQLNKTPRLSSSSVGAIGQPVNERRSLTNSSTLTSTTIGTSVSGGNGNHLIDPLDASSPSLLKRRSSPGSIHHPQQSSSHPIENSFFSNFLFGETTNRSPASPEKQLPQHSQHQTPLYQSPRSPTLLHNNSSERRYIDNTNWSNGNYIIYFFYYLKKYLSIYILN